MLEDAEAFTCKGARAVSGTKVGLVTSRRPKFQARRLLGQDGTSTEGVRICACAHVHACVPGFGGVGGGGGVSASWRRELLGCHESPNTTLAYTPPNLTALQGFGAYLFSSSLRWTWLWTLNLTSSNPKIRTHP